MNFKLARCYICGKTISDISRLRAYRISIHYHDNDSYRVLEEVNLKGQDPWSGIRVICDDCLDFFWEMKKGYRREDLTKIPGSDIYIPNIET